MLQQQKQDGDQPKRRLASIGAGQNAREVKHLPFLHPFGGESHCVGLPPPPDILTAAEAQLVQLAFLCIQWCNNSQVHLLRFPPVVKGICRHKMPGDLPTSLIS